MLTCVNDLRTGICHSSSLQKMKKTELSTKTRYTSSASIRRIVIIPTINIDHNIIMIIIVEKNWRDAFWMWFVRWNDGSGDSRAHHHNRHMAYIKCIFNSVWSCELCFSYLLGRRLSTKYKFFSWSSLVPWLPQEDYDIMMSFLNRALRRVLVLAGRVQQTYSMMMIPSAKMMKSLFIMWIFNNMTEESLLFWYLFAAFYVHLILLANWHNIQEHKTRPQSLVLVAKIQCTHFCTSSSHGLLVWWYNHGRL